MDWVFASAGQTFPRTGVCSFTSLSCMTRSNKLRIYEKLALLDLVASRLTLHGALYRGRILYPVMVTPSHVALYHGIVSYDFIVLGQAFTCSSDIPFYILGQRPMVWCYTNIVLKPVEFRIYDEDNGVNYCNSSVLSQSKGIQVPNAKLASYYYATSPACWS